VRDLEEQRETAHQDRDRLLENALAASAAIADIVHAAHRQVPPIAKLEMTDLDRQTDQAIEPELTISEAASHVG
jgi:hypothetical protein